MNVLLMIRKLLVLWGSSESAVSKVGQMSMCAPFYVQKTLCFNDEASKRDEFTFQ